jgi:hypothetical protein
MPENDPLFSLVKALSKNERRNFALDARRAGRKPGSGYLALYDWYSRRQSAGSPDRETLRRMGLTPNRLAVQKNYLYHRLLDSMLRHSTALSPEARVRVLINKSEMLLEKGMTVASLRLLESAEELAVSCFSYQLQLDVLIRREAHLQKYDDITLFPELSKRKKELLAIIDNIGDYQQLSYKVFGMTRHHDFMHKGHLRRKLDAVIRNPLLQQQKAALSPIATFHRYHTLCHYANIAQDAELAVRYGREHLEVFDREEAATRHELEYYITLLFNITVEMLQLNSVSDIPQCLRRWKELPARFANDLTPHMRIKWNLYDMELQLRMHFLNGSGADVVRLLPQIQRLWNARHAYVPIFRASSTTLIVFGLHAAGKSRQALKWLIDVVNDEKVEYRRYRILLRGLLLRILIFYDLKQEDVVENLCRQLNRFFIRQDRRDDPAAFVPGVFLEVLKKPGVSLRRELFAQALQRLTANFAQSGAWSVMYDLLFLHAWFYAAANRKPLAAVVPHSLEVMHRLTEARRAKQR